MRVMRGVRSSENSCGTMGVSSVSESRAVGERLAAGGENALLLLLSRSTLGMWRVTCSCSARATSCGASSQKTIRLAARRSGDAAVDEAAFCWRALRSRCRHHSSTAICALCRSIGSLRHQPRSCASRDDITKRSLLRVEMGLIPATGDDRSAFKDQRFFFL